MVIGAGLTGATLSLALARAGFEVDLYEQAPRLDEVGAGISLSPNALRALAWVGVAKELERVADLPGPGAILHFRTGELLHTVDRGAGFAVESRHGFMQLRRCDLLQALTARIRATPAIRVHLASRLQSLEASASGVTVRFDGGAEGSAELLAGCDGLRSTVRALAFEESPPRATGQLAWRCLVDAHRVRRHLGAGSSAIYIGPKRFVNRYLVDQGRRVNVVAIARSDRTAHEGWFNQTTYEEFEAEYAGWHEDVLGLVRHAPQGGLFTWALFDREPLSRWSSGPVVLAGDAAHPMLPFLGLGAALGLEDAVVLARVLERHGPGPSALQRYEAARVARCASALRDSRTQGELYQAADPEHYGAAGRLAELRLPYFGYDASAVPF